MRVHRIRPHWAASRIDRLASAPRRVRAWDHDTDRRARSLDARSRTLPPAMESHARAVVSRILAVAVAAACLLAARPAKAATIERASIIVGQGERYYRFVRPDHAPEGPRPLVLILHGHGGSAAGALGRTGAAAPLGVCLKIADREGLVLAALDGVVGRDGL